MDQHTPPRQPLWGAATAACAVEGDDAGVAGARGESIRDRFCRAPGAAPAGGPARSPASAPAQHLAHQREDLALMTELGLEVYRFSLAWPRVMPSGRPPVSRAGLAVYQRTVEALCARGIQPIVALYHWDLPQELEDAGGWTSRDTAGRFADHADQVARALGSAVSRWITVVDPWTAAMSGYQRGLHAPGRRDPAAARAALHHLLLGHGLAAAALRAELGSAARLGPALGLTEAGVAPAVLEPILGRGYPVDADPAGAGITAGVMMQERAGRRELVRDGDLATIAAPLDFLAVDQMSGEPAAADLAAALVQLEQQAAVPLCLTTSGGAAEPERGSALRDVLAAVLDASAQGAAIDACLVWSLLDGFEWDRAAAHRFGLFEVDPVTEQRRPRSSARLLARLIRERRPPEAGEEATR